MEKKSVITSFLQIKVNSFFEISKTMNNSDEITNYNPKETLSDIINSLTKKAELENNKNSNKKQTIKELINFFMINLLNLNSKKIDISKLKFNSKTEKKIKEEIAKLDN